MLCLCVSFCYACTFAFNSFWSWGESKKKLKRKRVKFGSLCRFFLAIDKQRQYVNKICALDAAGKIEKKKGREEKAGRDCVRALKDKAVH